MQRLWICCAIVLTSRAALAATCGGFSVVPADHVVIKYSAPVATGATHSTPVVSVNGSNVTVTRNVSGGSSIDAACVDDSIDLGVLPAGRYSVNWSDTVGFTPSQTQFTFVVAEARSGSVPNTTLIPPALPDKPVRLELVGCSATPAVAAVVGHQINVVQYGSSSSACRLWVLELGPLPVGRYDVSTTRVPASQTDPAFGFIVQQPSPSSACGGGFSVNQTAATSHLRYEDSYAGYDPQFGPPTASEIITSDSNAGYAITVTQPVADVADSRVTTAAPPQTVCHAEELDLGALPDGYYTLNWYDAVTVFGADAGYRHSPATAFRLSHGALKCTSDSLLQVPSEVPANLGFDIARTKLDVNAIPRAIFVAVYFGLIRVTESLYHEGSIPLGLPQCYKVKTSVAGLPPGEYTVYWTVNDGHDLYGPPLEAMYAHVTVSGDRRRAARH